jgi:hypothetical protein
MKLRNEDESGTETYYSLQFPDETETGRKIYKYIHVYRERESN